MKKGLRIKCHSEGISQRQSHNHQKKTAFTLAEVLITLGIIGIVAALTIPNLTRLHQQKTSINKVKKFYSTVANASMLAEVEHGPINDWFDTGTSSTKKEIFDRISKNMLLSGVEPYVDSSWVYFRLKDGTCGKFRINMPELYGYRENGMYWTISTNCNRGNSGSGVTDFEFCHKNLKKPREKCNVSQDGFSFTDSEIFSDYGICSSRTTATAAWKTYECFIKLIGNSWEFKSNYHWKEQKTYKSNSKQKGWF